MSKLYLGSIDLNKIDKNYIVSTDKNGKKFENGAKYLNIALWVNDQPDRYENDASIQMGDKDNKIYIGNLKEYKKEDEGTPNVPQPTDNETDEDDDLPF